MHGPSNYSNLWIPQPGDFWCSLSYGCCVLNCTLHTDKFAHPYNKKWPLARCANYTNSKTYSWVPFFLIFSRHFFSRRGVSEVGDEITNWRFLSSWPWCPWGRGSTLWLLRCPGLFSFFAVLLVLSSRSFIILILPFWNISFLSFAWFGSVICLPAIDDSFRKILCLFYHRISYHKAWAIFWF